MYMHGCEVDHLNNESNLNIWVAEFEGQESSFTMNQLFSSGSHLYNFQHLRPLQLTMTIAAAATASNFCTKYTIKFQTPSER